MKITRSITISLIVGGLFLSACGEGVQKDQAPVDIQELAKKDSAKKGPEIAEAEITMTTPLNTAWVSSGKGTYEVKCQSCHRLTEEKLVGPGWKDVTKRRAPVWIMNMITNTEMMLDTDPEAQRLLELCMVRMPNQNLSKDDARQVLEFMRSNDGVK